jgi:hypothetical protein
LWPGGGGVLGPRGRAVGGVRAGAHSGGPGAAAAAAHALVESRTCNGRAVLIP